jgi:hypothetical protein
MPSCYSLPRSSQHQRCAAVLLGLLSALTVSCQETTDAPDANARLARSHRSRSVTVAGPEAVLRASRDYGPPTSWNDGEFTPPSPLSFRLPASLPVIAGNSGNHLARLSFRDAGGVTVTCDYRGGSSQPHPTTEYERALAQSYQLERCSNEAAAGAQLLGTWFQLHVQLGDQKDPAGRTEIELRLRDRLPVLPAPLSAPESIALRDAFRWSATQPLAETNAEGLPALYYMLVYVEDREQLSALDELQFHHSKLPLFSAELERWEGQQGIFTYEGDGHGLFVFAFVPGRIYNLIRAAALEGNVIFRAMPLRTLPEAARGADGSLSYAALRASGFRYRDEDPPAATQGVGTSTQPLFGTFLRGVVNGIAEVGKEVGVGVRRGIGWVDRQIGGSIELTVALDLRNTDPGLGGRVANDGPGDSQPFQRAWGPNTGTQATLPGVRVLALQSTAFGLLPTAFTADTDETGVARMQIHEGKPTSFCIATENDAAEITAFLTESQVCNFARLEGDALEEDTTVTLYLQHPYFNVLAQATEGYAYLSEVAGYKPHRADILVGRLANLIGRNDRAFAPAFGFPSLSYDITLATIAAAATGPAGAVGGPAAVAAIMAMEPLYAVDIILPDSRVDVGGIRYDSNKESRGVVTHEYGHFALASMLYDEGADNITIAYTGAMLSLILNGESAMAEGAYLNEAFADFFAGQVAGGTNYNRFPGSFPQMGPMYFCPASSAACLDANASSEAKYVNQIARITSTLHDAFDGWSQYSTAPGSGSVWIEDPVSGWLSIGPPPAAPPSPPLPSPADQHDEEVKLSGWHIRNLFRRWDQRGTLLTEVNLMGGLADSINEAGVGWCQACNMFALHDALLPLGASPAEREARCGAEPIRSWIGAKPATGASRLALQPGPEDGEDAYIRQPLTFGNLLSFGRGHRLWVEYRHAFPFVEEEESRSYLKFELPTLPPGVSLKSAVLLLRADTTSDSGGHSVFPNSFYVRRVTSPWTEASVGFRALTGTLPSTTEEGQILVPRSSSPTQDYEVDVTGLIQGMLSGTVANEGLALESAKKTLLGHVVFASSDHPEQNKRPTLLLEFDQCL